MPDDLRLTLIGGPTVLVEHRGLRLLTDPTFDPPGAFPSGPVTLRKTAGPAVSAEAIGRVDAVLLSHDQHADNLDAGGRAVLAAAGAVYTTPAGAARLGGHAVGLASWQSAELPAPAGGRVRVTATPARHGPPGAEAYAGEVTGFVLDDPDRPCGAVYLTGDTVWYEGVAEVAARFDVRVVLPFVGAARLDAIGPQHLTMDAADAVRTARAFPNAVVVPVHADGWAHFSEGRSEVDRAFAAAGLADRLVWLTPGVPAAVPGTARPAATL